MAPRHYAIGANVRHGEVAFSKTKKKKVKFATPFDRIPAVQLTLGDASAQPPHRISVSKTHFWIRFTNKYTGPVSWTAMEM